MTTLVLASSSVYRQNILKKLGLEFITSSPDIDESSRPDESARNLVLRLSKQKALKVAQTYPDSLIIAGDQVAELDGHILTKPHTHERAREQLKACQNRPVTFYTGLTLYNPGTGHDQTDCLLFEVTFKPLTEEQIEGYLKKEKPYDCAGSFKAEGLGITLFSRLTGEDPNILTGLPLIRLVEMLKNEGIDPLLLP